MSVPKNNVKHFSQLFIATQNRKVDLGEFFQHENQMIPPSLSKDGIVNSAKPSKKDQTFLGYGLQVFLPKISKLSANAQRIDIVWDIYLEEILKASTRSSRSKGTRRKVEANTRTPGKWGSFLRYAENKTELFTFLAPLMTSSFCSDKILLWTTGNSIVKILMEILSSFHFARMKKQTQGCFYMQWKCQRKDSRKY